MGSFIITFTIDDSNLQNKLIFHKTFDETYLLNF